MRNLRCTLLFALTALAGAALPLSAQTVAATYEFNNTLKAALRP